ncbi:MAG: hypothetical protein R6U58_02060 [Bacteroidales bacterium]
MKAFRNSLEMIIPDRIMIYTDKPCLAYRKKKGLIMMTNPFFVRPEWTPG